MHKTITILMMSICFYACTMIDVQAQGKHSDVRLKENSWIRIVDEFVLNETPEEHCKSDNQAYTESCKRMFAGKNIRHFYVNIMFLQYCKAIKKDPKDPMASFLYLLNPDKPKPDDYDETQFPRYSCDYRTKVFATFLRKGREITTEGEVPYPKGGKKEILPGEITQIFFDIPEGTDFVHAWVPR